MSFKNILEKYRKISFSERDKGDRFERLMQAYLLTDPKYAYQFKKVYLWNEFPGKKDLGGSDTGIDLVAVTHDNDFWAIQCKCYQDTATIDKPAVDSFLSTSSREFKDDIQTQLSLKTVTYMTDNMYEIINNPAILETSYTDGPEYFNIFIKQNDMTICHRQVDAKVYPPKIRYTVDVRPHLKNLLMNLTDIFSSKNLTLEYMGVPLTV